MGLGIRSNILGAWFAHVMHQAYARFINRDSCFHHCPYTMLIANLLLHFARNGTHIHRISTSPHSLNSGKPMYLYHVLCQSVFKHAFIVVLFIWIFNYELSTC